MDIKKIKKKTIKILESIPYKKINILLIILACLGIILLVYNKELGQKIFFLAILLLGIDFMIYQLKFIIEDIEAILEVIGILIWILTCIGLLGKGMLYFIPKVFPEDIEKMFDLYTNFFTSITPAFIGILGVFLGSNQQIKHQERLNLADNKKREENLDRLFETFLKEEITYNFSVLSKRSLKEFFKSNEKPFDNCFYDKKKFVFDEFNSIKKEVISINSKNSEEIIDIYTMFKILEYNGHIINLNNEQYNFVKRVYLENVDLYELPEEINEKNN